MNYPQFDCDLIAAEKEKLIEQQAERIKELEAENAQLSQDLAWRNDELNKKDMALTTPQPAIPAGMVLVKLFDLENAIESYEGEDGQSCLRILRNIIAAAPKQENSHD